jgi:hypothetical protein
LRAGQEAKATLAVPEAALAHQTLKAVVAAAAPQRPGKTSKQQMAATAETGQRRQLPVRQLLEVVAAAAA